MPRNDCSNVLKRFTHRRYNDLPHNLQMLIITKIKITLKKWHVQLILFANNME